MKFPKILKRGSRVSGGAIAREQPVPTKLLWLYLLLWCPLVAACANSRPLSPEAVLPNAEVTPQSHESDALAVSSQSSPPYFQFDIVQELNDGNRLSLVAEVKANRAYPGEKGLMVLTTYSGLSPAESKAYSLCEVFGVGGTTCKLEPGSSVQFFIQAAATNITDYQLELLWGSDATSHIAYKSPVTVPATAMAAVPPAIQPNLDVANVEVVLAKLQVTEVESEGCKISQTGHPALGNSDSGCFIKFQIAGEIQNQGTDPQSAPTALPRTLNSVVLGVGFVHRSATTFKPESEEQVRFDNIALSSGESRPFSITIDQPLSRQQAQSFFPVVRIASFQ